MKTNVRKFALVSFQFIILFTLFCGDDPYNPLDMTDQRYQHMELDITTDISSTNDTISIPTDSTLELGIESNYLDRIDSIRIDFDISKINDQPVIIKRSDLEITSGETKIKLNSPHTFSQPGAYVVEVYAYTINGDNVSSKITILVGGVAPRITKNPVSVASAETDTARFSITAEGTRSLRYFWYFSADTSKEGILLNSNDTLDLTFTDDFVEMPDSGFYYCVVKNDFGSVSSRFAQLKVTQQILPADAPTVFFEKDSSAGEECVDAVLTLKLSAPYSKDVLVHITTLSSSQAKEFEDYTIKNSTVLIPAHATSANLQIDINDDVLGEGSEVLALQITNSARNARIGDHATQYYTIYDDDVADSTWPELYFLTSAGAGIEGENASIDVGLGLKTLNWQYVVSVICRVSSSSTASLEDYILVDSMLTFNINETSRRISLQTIKDKISENDEIVKIELILPGKAIFSKTRPTVFTYTIKDGDLCAIYFKKMEMKGIEEDTTSLKDSIEVNLTTPSVNEVTVKYEIVSGISTAVNQGTDYLLPGEGFIRFAPGIQVAWIPVVIMGDIIKEGEEIFGLKLSNPTGGAVIQNADPFKYIIADNEMVTLSFKTSGTSVNENIGDISVTVSLSKLASDTIRVDYKMIGNAQGTDADYIIKNDNNHTVTFPPGEREKTIDITIVDDIYDEPNKSFSIQLENPRGGSAEIGTINKHTVEILDNDIPYFSFVDAAKVVNEGAGKVSIPVKLSNPSLGPLGIRYNVSNSSSAIAGKDYVPFSTDTATFSAGDSLLSIDLVLTDDNIEETPENVVVNIFPLDSNTVAGAITTTTITITDNDAPASVAFVQDTMTIDESNDSVKLTLVVSGQTEKSISTAFEINYRTASCDSSDFAVLSAGRISLNAPDGRYIAIKFKDDRNFNENDTFYITLLDPQNAALGTIKTCKVAIRDNDYKMVVQRADTNGTVSPSGEQSVTRGIPLQIVATPMPHFHFTGWTVTSGINIVDASKATTAITATTTGGTVTANFVIDSFNVTFAAENGSVVPNGLVKAAWGDVLSPVPTAKPGYNFLAWSVTIDSIEPVGQLSSLTTKFRVKGTGTIRALHSNKAYSIEVASSDSRFGSVTPTTVQEKNWEETFEIKANANANAKFVQWKADSDSLLKSISDTLNATATVTVRKSGKITALFAPDSFTLTLQSGNTTMGRVDPATKKMTFFDSTQITATAETGYQFTGWTITVGVNKVSLNNPAVAQTIAKGISINATIQANFTPVQYAISTAVSPIISTPGVGSVLSDPTTSPLPYKTALKLTANANPGWKFDHWTGVPESQQSSNPANVTVGTVNNYAAVFIPQTFTLYFLNYAGDTATTSISSQSNIPYGVATTISASVTVNPLHSQKYEFTGVWILDSGNVTFGTGNTITLTSNAKIRPDLSKKKYALGIVSPQPTGGTVSLVSPATSSTYPYGTPVTLFADTTRGWDFVNWTATAGAIPTGPRTAGATTLTANTNYSAVFTKKTYTLAVSSPIANVILNPPVPTYFYDSATTFSATVSGYNTAQYQFNNTWTVTNAMFNTNYSKITLTGNAVATPVFSTRQYTFTCSTIPASGTGSMVALIASPQNYGTTINFTASPASGYKVKTWSGGNISATDLTHATATLTGTTAYNVEFEAENVTLTVDPPTNGTVSPSVGTHTYPYGTVVNLVATADTGYQFSSWTGTTGGASTTITMNGNKEISANFTEIPGKSGVVYVWSGRIPGNHSGSNWANAYSDLNTAVTAAATDAVIWVKCGEFAPTATLVPAAHVKIYGGFTGFEGPTQDVNNRYFYSHFTIIKGTSVSTIMDLSNGRDTIGGFVFTGATTNAIFIKSSSNYIEDCVIRNMGPASGTRAIYLMPPTGTISNNIIQRTVFHSNDGTNTTAGKAIHITSSAYSTQILNSVFYKNGGPAINNGNTTTDDANKTSIINCTILDNGNVTWAAPGGIKNSSGITFLQGTILWLNKSSVSAGTQIDVADWVEDCDVQDHTGTGVATKKRWQGDNLMVEPGFGTLSILSDDAWFTPSTSNPFKPGTQLRTADYSPKPLLDIRKYSRSGISPFLMGAYEQ